MPMFALRTALSPPVLVVERVAILAMLLEDALAEAGYRPLCTPGGIFVPGIADGGGDLAAAVVGLSLDSGVDGRDVIRRLRLRDPTLPVAVVTSYALSDPGADLRALGGPMLRLSKPADTDVLLAWLSDVLVPYLALGPFLQRRRSDPRLPVA